MNFDFEIVRVDYFKPSLQRHHLFPNILTLTEFAVKENTLWTIYPFRAYQNDIIKNFCRRKEGWLYLTLRYGELTIYIWLRVDYFIFDFDVKSLLYFVYI